MIGANLIMDILTKTKLKEYQSSTFRLRPDIRLTSPQQAIEYVNERGFIFFWPVKGYLYPSLWSAVAGERPVADGHDDPGHITWNWKDSLLDKKVWYYARILRHKNTIVSLDTVIYFYALSPNFGEPEEDFIDQYNQGLLPLETKLIFDALVKNGPLDTISLRKEAHLTGSNSTSPFNRALDILQQQFKVLPVAVSEAGAWKYAFVYDLTHRYFPDILENARFISENQAMDQLLKSFFISLGAASLKQTINLFRWGPEQTQKAIDRLLALGFLHEGMLFEDSSELIYCIRELSG